MFVKNEIASVENIICSSGSVDGDQNCLDDNCWHSLHLNSSIGLVARPMVDAPGLVGNDGPGCNPPAACHGIALATVLSRPVRNGVPA